MIDFVIGVVVFLAIASIPAILLELKDDATMPRKDSR